MRCDYYDAVTYDGAVYCVGCLDSVNEGRMEHQRVTEDCDEVSPIFADSEWDYYPTCDVCHTEHDYVSLTSDGMRWRSRRQWSDRIVSMLNNNGKLPAFTSVGCYPLAYYNVPKGEMYCPKCANDTSKELTLTDADVYWEGAPHDCDECGEPIESAYGDPAAAE